MRLGPVVQKMDMTKYRGTHLRYPPFEQLAPGLWPNRESEERLRSHTLFVESTEGK